MINMPQYFVESGSSRYTYCQHNNGIISTIVLALEHYCEDSEAALRVRCAKAAVASLDGSPLVSRVSCSLGASWGVTMALNEVLGGSEGRHQADTVLISARTFSCLDRGMYQLPVRFVVHYLDNAPIIAFDASAVQQIVTCVEAASQGYYQSIGGCAIRHPSAVCVCTLEA